MFNVQAYLADKSKTWELFDEQVSRHYDTLSDVISLGCTGSGTRGNSGLSA